MDAIISVKDVTKQYGAQIVLNNISMDIPKSSITGVIGRNGSGKTVLFKCICGLSRVSSGSIYVRQKKVGDDVDIPENVGIIIEEPGLLRNYSGYRNLKYLASIRNRIAPAKIKEYLSLVGLDPEDKKPVKKYSMGMKQRLGIAQAIMEDQEILILDEPFNCLDNQGVLEMRNLLLHLKNEGRTIIMSSHNPEDIKELCDKVYELDNGKILNEKK